MSERGSILYLIRFVYKLNFKIYFWSSVEFDLFLVYWSGCSENKKKMLPILKFPAEWNGSIDTSAPSYGVARVEQRHVTRYACKFCSSDLPSGDSWCYCVETTYTDVSSAVPRVDVVEVTEQTPGHMLWASIVQPYLNISANDHRTVLVLSDCARKLNALGTDGIGLLHGLMMAGDFKDLCQMFLELGVDTEARSLVRCC